MAPRLVITQGRASPTPARYGDYFEASRDPNDGTLVWTAGEYDNDTGNLFWSTLIASEKLLPSDFTITANPSNLGTVTAGGRRGTTVTINVTSINGFSGTVPLSAYAPSGVTASLNPTSVTISSGGLATSTLTLHSSYPVGNPPVVVTGQSGKLSHTASITWNSVRC